MHERGGEGTVVMKCEGLREFQEAARDLEVEERVERKTEECGPGVRMSMRLAPSLKLQSDQSAAKQTRGRRQEQVVVDGGIRSKSEGMFLEIKKWLELEEKETETDASKNRGCEITKKLSGQDEKETVRKKKDLRSLMEEETNVVKTVMKKKALIHNLREGRHADLSRNR
ncbi:hypothetical protein Bca4012_093737 [Brassica carinata]